MKNYFYGFLRIATVLSVLFLLSACSQDDLTYTITFDARGGSFVESIDFTKESSFSLPESTRTNHEFQGWYLSEEASEPFSLNRYLTREEHTNITLYARWEPVVVEPILITFSSDLVDPPKAHQIMPGESIDLPLLEDTETHAFTGWYLDDDYTQAVTSESSFNQSTTVYAQFERKPDPPVESLSVNIDTPLIVNETITYTLEIEPDVPRSRSIIVQSSNDSIIHVSGSTLQIRGLGSVTLSAMVSGSSLTFNHRLDVTTYGIQSQSDIDALANLTVAPEKVMLINAIDELRLSASIELDLNGHPVENLTIEGNQKTAIHLHNGTVKNFMIDAPQATVEANITIHETIIKAVSHQSFISQGRHLDSITIEGQGRIHLAGQASRSNVMITTDESVILDGTYQGNVEIDHEASNVSVEGQIAHLSIKSGQTIHLKESAVITQMSAEVPVSVIQEEGATLPDTLSDLLDVQPFIRLYLNHYDLPSPTGYHLMTPGERVDIVNNQVEKEGHTFKGWFLDADFTEPFDFSEPLETSTTLYAQFEIHTFNVRFIGDSVSVEAQTIDFNQRVNTPPTPRREGHRFVGWYTDSNGTTAYRFSSPVQTNLTLYAKWEENTYTVRFQGADVEAVSVAYNHRLSRPPTPSKDGHAFMGWYASLSDEEPYDFSQRINANMTLYAKWEINTYTLSYIDSNLDSIELPYNALIRAPETPVKDGHTFAGWYEDSALTEPFEFGSRIQSSTRLYAKWTVNLYTVTYLNGPFTATPHTEQVPYNALLPYPIIEETDDLFLGWADEADPDNILSPTDRVHSSMTLNAVWDENPDNLRMVYFMNLDRASLKIAQGSSLSLTPDERAGYAFQGWYTDATFETPLPNVVDGPLQVYAKYEPVVYTVRFDHGGIGEAIEPLTVRHGSRPSLPRIQNLENHEFVGWYVDANRTEAYSSSPVTDGLTLYAKWESETITVTYENASLNPDTVIYNQRLSRRIPEKAGYLFKGWYEDAEGQDAYDFSTRLTEDLTLYAQWEILTHEITFDAKDYAPRTVNHLAVLTPPSDPLKTGHEFIAWSLRETTFEPFDFTAPITQDVTLYPFFEKSIYTLTFNPHQSSLNVPALTLEYLAPMTLPQLTASGVIFEGWYLDVDYSVRIVNQTPVTESLELHGKWSEPLADEKVGVYFMNLSWDSLILEKEEPLSLTSPALEGHTFDGWYIDETFETRFTASSLTESVQLYALFTPYEYTINFVSDLVTLPSVSVRYNTALLAPETPEIEGYNFTGWFGDAEMQTAFDFEQTIVTDQAIYLAFERLIYTVQWIDQGTLITAQSIAHGERLEKPTDPAQTGLIFEGWHESATEEDLFSFAQPITEDTALYAQYSIQTLNVTFKNAIIPPQVVRYGERATRPDDPIREGHTFAGWVLSGSESTPFDYDQTIITNTSIDATWEANTYTLSLDPDVLGEDAWTQAAIYGIRPTPPEPPEKPGYTFIGWYFNETLWNFSTDTMPSQDIVLTARYVLGDDTLFRLENKLETATTVEIELWIRGEVDLNAYHVLIRYDVDQMTYSTHTDAKADALDVSRSGEIELSYVNVNQTIDEETKIIKILFNKAIEDTTIIDVEIIDALKVNSDNTIVQATVFAQSLALDAQE